jgi:murein DD-endopeptidase MepM/ murein hydrolase activator NlpD
MAPRHLDPSTPSLPAEFAAGLVRWLRRPATAVAAGLVAASITGAALVPGNSADPAPVPPSAADAGTDPSSVPAAAARVATEASSPPPPAPAPAPAPAPPPPPAPSAVRPVDDYRLTSGFGPRWGTMHAGVDFAAPLGTPEKAVMAGTVVVAGPVSGFGQAVYIQHDNGDVTVYGHMRTILVSTGERVAAGQVIAELGSEGQSTGPHLHLEVHLGGINGQKVDPIPWLAARGVTV